MTSASIFSAIGLLLDIVGVTLVFVFPILSDLDENIIIYADPTPEQIGQAKRIKRFAYLGFILIIIGFILQLTGTIMSGLE
jgi:hypothetical protein